MEPASRLIDPLSARLPAFSVDWRFLLPIHPSARVLLLVDTQEDISQYFSALDTTVLAHPRHALRDLADAFDIIVIPFGIPAPLLTSDLCRLLKPGGSLLIGFANRWSPRKNSSDRAASFAPAALKRRLEQLGLHPVALYGAYPNLTKPAYILPLKLQTLRFFLHNRFPGGRASRLLTLASLPFFPALLSRILPCYFMIARLDT